MIDAARENIGAQRTAATLQPGSSIRQQLELHRPPSLRLRHGGPRSDLATANDVADFEAYDVAPPKFAVDRDIEQRSVAKATMMIQIEADAPYLFRFQRTLRTNVAPGVPRLPVASAGSYSEVPIVLLLRPDRPRQKRGGSLSIAIEKTGPDLRVTTTCRRSSPQIAIPKADRQLCQSLAMAIGSANGVAWWLAVRRLFGEKGKQAITERWVRIGLMQTSNES
ncbi:hypothetical protein HZF05_07560 [Sphingomonas sp. CGMCC 1.13654]|uniref:Uncharacterized protein n=1 Tax=Sphingomonas chungangi TaxID=2683589 RepID=A0A838L5I7_9SPHN|nr:hypothetical protein [Sphingomonas chungangi]